MSPLAKVAASGFHDASAYDAHRPSYRPEVVAAFLGRLGIWESAAVPYNVVEIGAGTGKFTEVLSRKAAADASLQITAVEPHAQMRAQLTAKALPHVRVVDGHGASLGAVPDASADAIIVAQAFHWFANADALAEIHRVLKPGARLGVVWNIEDYNKPRTWPAATHFDQALNDIVLGLAPDGCPRFRDGQWQQPLADAAAQHLFTPLADDRLAWTATLSVDALWKRLQTLSQIANLPADGGARAAIQQEVEAAAARPDAPRDAAGHVTIHAHTYFAWTQKI